MYVNRVRTSTPTKNYETTQLHSLHSSQLSNLTKLTNVEEGKRSLQSDLTKRTIKIKRGTFSRLQKNTRTLQAMGPIVLSISHPKMKGLREVHYYKASHLYSKSLNSSKTMCPTSLDDSVS